MSLSVTHFDVKLTGIYLADHPILPDRAEVTEKETTDSPQSEDSKTTSISECLVLDDSDKGVIIKGITDETITAKSGLQAGDEIVAATVHLNHLNKNDVLKILRVLEPYDNNMKVLTKKELSTSAGLGHLGLGLTDPKVGVIDLAKIKTKNHIIIIRLYYIYTGGLSFSFFTQIICMYTYLKQNYLCGYIFFFLISDPSDVRYLLYIHSPVINGLHFITSFHCQKKYE
ncbi:hypothetical protein INR49_016405 [Caranx melampygus]|nr:hypothetical protein INR49_016405 [Caranx melampygus]